MIGRVAFVIALFGGAGAWAADTGSQPAQPGRITHASADDCAIIVEIGKAKMRWGDKAPNSDFFPTFDNEGGGIYVEDCVWKDFGVADPVIGTPNSLQGFFISRPEYSGTKATTEFDQVVRPVPGLDGSSVAPFMEKDRCTLEKIGGRWRIVECKMLAIT
jgi:hypothetical protein